MLDILTQAGPRMKHSEPFSALMTGDGPRASRQPDHRAGSCRPPSCASRVSAGRRWDAMRTLPLRCRVHGAAAGSGLHAATIGENMVPTVLDENVELLVWTPKRNDSWLVEQQRPL
eukprot:13397721-Alexandrium_andersonii.AAC.1